jgi:hypothetical protein
MWQICVAISNVRKLTDEEDRNFSDVDKSTTFDQSETGVRFVFSLKRPQTEQTRTLAD